MLNGFDCCLKVSAKLFYIINIFRIMFELSSTRKPRPELNSNATDLAVTDDKIVTPGRVLNTNSDFMRFVYKAI
jgi:hypothetical protein